MFGWLRDGWLVIGITVLVFGSIEAGLFLAFKIYDRSTSAPTRYADAYDDAPWVADYWQEYASTGMKWHPYVYWRHRPYRGRFINIDESGFRVTVPTESVDTSPTIYMFGGSTMWGVGARDGYTIPSSLGRELAKRGVSATIVNFGENGYVSTQERIALELALQRGERPDLVIFYDGINDTYAAWQNGVAGWPQNEQNRVGEFNLLNKQRLGDRARSVLLDVLLGLSTRRFVAALLPTGDADPQSSRFPAAATTDMRLPEQIVQVYTTNIDAVRALGEHYGFATLSYWQPSILDKAQLTAWEQPFRSRMAALEEFFRRTNELIRQRPLDSRSRPCDITGVFADVPSPIFLDQFHPSEAGNELIARTMVADVLAAFANRQSKPATTTASAQSKPDGLGADADAGAGWCSATPSGVREPRVAAQNSV